MFQPVRDLYLHEGNRAFLWLPVLLAVGIGIYFSLPYEPSAWLGIIALLAICAGTLALYRHCLPWPAGLALIVIVLGFFAAQTDTLRTQTPMLEKDIGFTPLTGVVRDIELLPEGRRLWISNPQLEKLRGQAAPGLLRLTDRKVDQNLTIGAPIQMTAFVRAIPAPVVPGDFDFRRNAYFAGLGATGYAIAITPQDVVANEPTSFAAARQVVQDKVSGTISDDPAAIATALLTGSQNGISKEVMNDMRLSGLTHILSVSGLHIGLAAGIIFVLLRALLALIPRLALRYPIKKWAAAASFFGALAYTLFVGAPVPAVRSLLMIGFALLAILVDRTALSLRVVAMTAAVILLIAPHALMNPSFQLSYAAITAIIAIYEMTEPLRHRLMENAGWLKRALAAPLGIAVTSIAASLATAPLTHYHFQQLQGYGVISNMLAIPLTSFWLMPAALVSFVAMPLGLEHWPLVALGKGLEWLMWIAHTVATLPGANWQPANLPFPALLLMVLGSLWLVIWQLRWRWLGLAPIAAGIILAGFPAQPLALISDDGRFAAVQRDQGYVLLTDNDRRHDDSFMPSEWAQWLGVKEWADNAALCNATYCQTGRITFIRDPNVLADLCGRMDMAIHSHGTLKNCGKTNIDRPLLRREGTIMLSDEGKMTSVEGAVGNRPWAQRYKSDED